METFGRVYILGIMFFELLEVLEQLSPMAIERVVRYRVACVSISDS